MGSKGVNFSFVLMLFLLFQLKIGLAPKPVFAENLDNLTIEVESVVTGLILPVSIKNAGDGSGNLFIVEQVGRVLIYDGAQLLPNAFLDISSLVSTGSERGLLDIVFHPDYAANGFFYVNYTNLPGNTVVARYNRSADPQLADPSSETILLTVSQPFANHNGGQLGFGPDGFLYIALGDGGVPGTSPANPAQDLSQLLGKILRIDINGGPPYAIPADNPFAGVAGARPEIWAYGLRNPWRFSFDRETGDLLVADVGQSRFEEVNFQAAASPGGENYGWPLMEGSSCFVPSTNCNDGSLTLPVVEYDHMLGNCSISGGYRHRGNNFPQLNGVYFYGDFCTGRIWGADTDINGDWFSKLLLDTTISITTFGEDESGDVYLVAYNAGDLLRIKPVRTAFNDFDANSTSDLLAFNTTGGQTGVGLMAAAVLQSANLVTTLDLAAGWTLNATGDFNGDRTADLLLFNTTTGEVRMVLLDGSTILSDTVVIAVPPAPGLQPQGIGDIDGDGKSDILLFDPATTRITGLLMDGASIVASGTIVNVGAPSDWRLNNTGDFDGDGRDDLFIRNTSTGAMVVVPLNGLMPSGGVVSLVLNLSLGWDVVDTGDFNGDGNADLLVLNTTSGALGQVLLDGAGGVLSGVLLFTLDIANDWSAVNAGDYDGDGDLDVLLFNTGTGEVNVLLLEDGVVLSQPVVANLTIDFGWTLHSGKP